jgi:hypothetical protein
MKVTFGVHIRTQGHTTKEGNEQEGIETKQVKRPRKSFEARKNIRQSCEDMEDK